MFGMDLLKQIKKENEANEDLIFTGEKELYINKKDFIEKISQNKHGLIFLNILEIENHILERQGLIAPAGVIYFLIPDYDMLLVALHAFYITCYREENING